MSMSINNLINKEVEYRDYIGFPVIGTIIHVEDDYRLPDDEVFVYIVNNEDINNEIEIHEKIVDNKVIKYTDIRKSSEIQLL